MAWGTVNIGGSKKNTATDVAYSDNVLNTGLTNVQGALDKAYDIILPKLTISVTAGSAITLTNGTHTVTGTSGSGGTFTADLPALGTWTATAELDGESTDGNIEITELGKSYSLKLQYFTATLTVTTAAGATVTAIGSTTTYTATADSSGKAVITVKRAGSYTVRAVVGDIPSNSTTVNVTSNGSSYTATTKFIVLTVTVDSGSAITVTDGTHTYTKTGTGSDTWYLPNTGTWTVTATKNGETATDTVSVTAYQGYTLELAYVKIYGVTWDKSAKTTLTRTDDAALFTDPVPSVDGSAGSSPFDNCMPWKGMEKVEDSVAGTLVKIPKFWYKWTETSTALKLQIADKAVSGFHVSPAHADRGDGKGERDYVYIGRYKCNSSYKSAAGYSPVTSITRATARTNIAKLGTGYYQQDFALFWTIRMLYLVEYANWDGQAAIGYGCGNGSSKQNAGTTDGMTYHTGTTQSSKTTYGTGVQYRWIEDPWGNVLEWCDGIYFISSNIYVINNPENFSDNSGGTKTGTRPTSDGYISSWGVPSASGLEWALYPNAANGDETTYIADCCGCGSGGVVLCVGGCYSVRNRYCGPFCLYGYYSASYTYSDIGSRLQKLP